MKYICEAEIIVIANNKEMAKGILKELENDDEIEWKIKKQGKEMTVKTLGRCEWKDIKVGEVFAEYFDNTWWIHLKRQHNPKDGIIILQNNFNTDFIYTIETMNDYWDDVELHKLPKSFQRNFIDWGER